MARKQLVPLDMDNSKIINLATPTVGTDAATKDYVDANAGAGLTYRTELVNDEDVLFTDDVVYVASGVPTINLPHDTTGYTGKRIRIVNIAGHAVTIIETTNLAPLSTSSFGLDYIYDSITVEAKAYDPTPGVQNWTLGERTNDGAARHEDIITNYLPQYVPYTGATTDIDATGVSIKALSFIGQSDTDNVFVMGGEPTVSGGVGGNVIIQGASSIESAAGGAVILQGGVGNDDNGGNINITPGDSVGAGSPGKIFLSSPDGNNTVSLDVSANAELLFGPYTGVIMIGVGTNGITVGTSPPPAPGPGDLWYDTN